MSARSFLVCVGAALVLVFVIFTTGFRAPPGARQATAAPSAAGVIPDEDPAIGYRLGVFPFLPALTLDRVFALVVADLGAGLGHTIHFRTKPNFEGFAEAIEMETYDIIFVHPFFYVTAADDHGYVPLARLHDPLVVAVFARNDSSVRDLSDLRGRTLGLPPKLAAVSQIMLSELEAQGNRPGGDVRIQHFQSKMSCLHSVILGSIDACALPRFALAHLQVGRVEELRVIHESAPFPSVVFAAHRRVPEQDRKRLEHLIVGWDKSSGGRAILAAGKWDGFVAAQDSDYDPIRLHKRERREFSQRQ